eukprot:scaffold3648_cov92-Skeletonema_dohrnii-CCMP3373.AAC.7
MHAIANSATRAVLKGLVRRLELMVFYALAYSLPIICCALLQHVELLSMAWSFTIHSHRSQIIATKLHMRCVAKGSPPRGRKVTSRA